MENINLITINENWNINLKKKLREEADDKINKNINKITKCPIHFFDKAELQPSNILFLSKENYDKYCNLDKLQEIKKNKQKWNYWSKLFLIVTVLFFIHIVN
jgi:lipopolysaccharide export LptBFGC system permease protein LptF